MPERLTARPLAIAVEPEAVFRIVEARAVDVFWLDAGADAADGWSVVGEGVPDQLPREVRLDVEAADPSLPPFLGGWVGWHDYESGARAAGAPAFDAEPLGSAWMRVTRAVAFDHATGRRWVLGHESELDEWTAQVAAASRRADTGDGDVGDVGDVEVGDVEVADVEVGRQATEAQARHAPEEYAALIERCRALIRAGTAYQLCLTTRFTVPGRHDPVAVYRRLRAATPAHHGGLIRTGERTLLSASPEQFLHAAGGVVRTRPIKGTRPRSADPRQDAALAAELVASAKERAENVMIVDLMRNDLSRVSVPGSIRVDALWAVESYPAVHQLVSTVRATVAPGTTVGGLLDAAFPAGSMTGAPKLSAMTRLHELEGGPRGVYAGCFGYIGADGALDLAMVIRSIVVDADAAVVGAGGGITWGSDPIAEVAEVATKARAPLRALGAALPGAWGSDILG